MKLAIGTALFLAAAMASAEGPDIDVVQEYDGRDLYIAPGAVDMATHYELIVNDLAREYCHALRAENRQHWHVSGYDAVTRTGFPKDYLKYCIANESEYLHEARHHCVLLANGHFADVEMERYHGLVDNPDVAAMYCVDRRFRQYRLSGSYDPVPGARPSWIER